MVKRPNLKPSQRAKKLTIKSKERKLVKRLILLLGTIMLILVCTTKMGLGWFLTFVIDFFSITPITVMWLYMDSRRW